MSSPDQVSVLIAELHASGLSNQKIGYLLPQYGGEARDEATVRRWAKRAAEPKASDWEALKLLHASTFPIERSAETPIEVAHPET